MEGDDDGALVQLRTTGGGDSTVRAQTSALKKLQAFIDDSGG
jgi:hypothetical protein